MIVAEPMVGGMLYALDGMGHDDMQDMLNGWTEAWQRLLALQLAELPGDTWQQAVQEAELRTVLHGRGQTALH